jgi:hypothetical protein
MEASNTPGPGQVLDRGTVPRRRLNEVRTMVESTKREIATFGDSTPWISETRGHLDDAEALTTGWFRTRVVDDAWRHVHEAHRIILKNSTIGLQMAKSVELRKEARSGKLNGWRKDAIESLLDTFDASAAAKLNSSSNKTGSQSPDPKPEALPLPAGVDHLVKAAEIRDEGVTNTYRRLALTRDYTLALLGCLVVSGVALVVMLASHGSDLKTTGNPMCPTTTGRTVAFEAACQDGLLARRWVLTGCLLAGSIGATTSALQRIKRDTSTGRVPDFVAQFAAAGSRVGIGAVAGSTLYLALRSGAVEFPRTQVIATAILGAFSFGFAERVFVIGEKPKDSK